MVQFRPVQRRVSVMTVPGDCASYVHSDVRLLSALKRVRSGTVVWGERNEGKRVEGQWPQRQNEYAREMMARQEYRHREDHLDETGCVNAGVALPGVVFESVNVQGVTRVAAVVNVSANVNVTGDECARVHGLRTHLRDPSQRDAPRSSERVRPAIIIEVNYLRSLQWIMART